MSINVNDKSNTTFYFTAPIFLPAMITDSNFLDVYSSTSSLPSSATNFNLAGIAGTGSMYVYLNGGWQYLGQYLYDAYRYLVYYEGSAFASASGTKWTDVFNDIASNSSLMTEFSANSTAMTNLAASSTAMNAVAASSTAMNAVAASSTAINIVTASSTAMNAVAASSTAMNILAASSTCMSTVAGSSTAMNAIIASYTAMNALTTLAAKNAFQSASSQLSIIQTLVSNINSGSIVLGGGATGSSTALGYNALLVLLSYNNGAAVPPGNATSSPTPTLASKMYAAYSPTQHTAINNTVAVLTLATNQIVFAVGAYSTGAGYVGMGDSSSNPSDIVSTPNTSIVYPNENVSPLRLSGSLYVFPNGTTIYYYYLTYTPS